ncbi:MAG: SPOR domain-containing protein [Gammaproteobacteria bacterium]|jgi:cell division protein FtsN
MAGKKRRKAGHKGGARSSGSSTPGWVYMLIGLSIGLTVAYAVYVNDRKQIGETVTTAPVEPPAREPASAVPEEIEEIPEASVTFDFYEMLPNLDVEVYEEEREPVRTLPQATPEPPAPVTRQGIYILQAGSFSRLEDANRRKAELGLLGVRSDIMKGAANGRTVYRVYTEPMEQPEEVNRTSNLLTGAGIEVMRKRVSD